MVKKTLALAVSLLFSVGCSDQNKTNPTSRSKPTSTEKPVGQQPGGKQPPETTTSKMDPCPEAPLAFYKCWDSRKADVEQDIVTVYGKSLDKFSADDYQRFLKSLDLANNSDLMKWSIATGVPVVALQKSSGFYYFNTHIIDDPSASTWDYAKFSTLQTSFDTTAAKISVTDSQKKPLPVFNAAHEAIVGTTSENNLTFYKDFAEQKVSFDALAPYLLTLDTIGFRSDIMAALKNLPLQFIKPLRGKAIYFADEGGRSYAVTQPVSNSIYPGFAGLMPGLFMERNTATQTPLTFVHELCHVIDHTAIGKGYGNFYFTYQFLALQPFLAEKETIFGKGDAAVPDLAYGYISSYAKTNAQENFAEHCSAYFTMRDAFKKKAEEEAGQGQALLMDKFKFVEKIFKVEDVSYKKLDADFIKGIVQ